MPFAPYGKKAKRRRAQEAKREERERIIDRAIGAAHGAVQHRPGLCLPMCVLLERILARVLLPPRFSIRLVALHVHPVDEEIDPITFDPRTDRGIDIDAGFHAWLENESGQLLEPSVFLTLQSKGYYLPQLRKGLPAVAAACRHHRERLGDRLGQLRRDRELALALAGEIAGELDGHGRSWIVGAPPSDVARQAAVSKLVDAVYPGLEQELRAIVMTAATPTIFDELVKAASIQPTSEGVPA